MISPGTFDASDPDWLAHRFVESADMIRFIDVPRGERTGVSFLTDACLGPRPDFETAPVAECLARFEPAPLGWLFHSAFCGSTMLGHAFDVPGVSSSLSEPVLLNDVVGFRRRGAAARDVARIADVALRLLARPYAGDRAVIVKPSNVANPLAELFLALQPAAPAVFLFAPLETFLISVARKGLQCRLWVRELLEGYLRESFVDLGFAPEDYFRQSDLQIAAVGWLAQHSHFTKLAEKLGSGRLRMLDADAIVADPRATIAAVGGHFGLGLDEARIDAIASGPAFARHSKSGASYSAEARRADYAAARASHGDEIGTVLEWAGLIAERAGVAMAPKAPLLAQEV